jgi:hypothetical protein
LEQKSANQVSNLYESDHENDDEVENDDNIEVYDDDDNNEDENHFDDVALRVSSAPNILDDESMDSAEEINNCEYERISENISKTKRSHCSKARQNHSIS